MPKKAEHGKVLLSVIHDPPYSLLLTRLYSTRVHFESVGGSGNPKIRKWKLKSASNSSFYLLSVYERQKKHILFHLINNFYKIQKSLIHRFLFWKKRYPFSMFVNKLRCLDFVTLFCQYQVCLNVKNWFINALLQIKLPPQSGKKGINEWLHLFAKE